MIIYLSNSIKDAISSGSLSPVEIGALEDIGSAVRSGDHLILGDSATLLSLSKYVKLGEAARAAFKNVFSRVPQQESILEKVETYAEVTIGDGLPTLKSEENKSIISIPLPYCAEMNLRAPLEVIFEEINDQHIYEIITAWYANSALSVRMLNRKYRPIHGGGGRTHAVFSDAQRMNNCFCLCITDSDKKFPADAFGPTSINVRNANDQSKVLSHHVDLDFHEIENLVPLSFISHNSDSRHTDAMIAALQNAEQNGHQEAKLFFDYKKGLKYSFLQTTPEAHRYWTTVLPVFNQQCSKGCAANTCTCDILKPLQNRARIRDQIQSLTPITPTECPTLEALWKNIGATLVSWSAAAPARLV